MNLHMPGACRQRISTAFATQPERYRNPDNDPRGPWKAVDYLNQVATEKRPNLVYDIVNPHTGETIKNRAKAWNYEQSVHLQHVADNRLWWGESGNNTVPALKLFLSEVRDGLTPHNWWSHEDAGHTDEARKELDSLGLPMAFDTPKPTRLINRVLQIATGPDDLILDSFAGSGTTGHAVLDLNKQDGGNRRFILVEMEEKVARNVTAERLRRVIAGYDKGGDPAKPVEGLGGGFRFCRLGVPLFDEFGDIADAVTFPDLAAHIFFAETGVPIPHRAQSELLGTHQGRAVYLLFDEINREVPQEAAGNVLTPDRLTRLPDPSEGFEGLRVVYAEGCTVSADRLKAVGVMFKQIPYQVEGV
jgi:adenine-specific DNA-methyltransferase